MNRIYSTVLARLILMLTMAATLFALNFLGDGLRDAFDPKANL